MTRVGGGAGRHRRGPSRRQTKSAACPLRAALTAGLAAVLGVSCAGGAVEKPVTITVLAAASLTDAFTEMGEAFSAERPEVQVRFNFGASSGLATQVLQGAPGDILAVADQAAADAVVAAGEASAAPQVFAHNSMEIAVPVGNPGGVTGLGDFARPELLIGACAEEVPCGRIGRRLLHRASVAPAIDTNEADVRSLLTKIEAGELDAGLVYRSDVMAGEGAVEGIEVAGAAEVLASYPIVALAGATAREEAQAFVAFVRSGEGQRILTGHGLLAR